MCNKFFFNYISGILLTMRGRLCLRHFFANSCFALKVYSSFLFGCRVYVRYHWGLVSSFVNRRASYRANMYSKILIVVT